MIALSESSVPRKHFVSLAGSQQNTIVLGHLSAVVIVIVTAVVTIIVTAIVTVIVTAVVTVIVTAVVMSSSLLLLLAL